MPARSLCADLGLRLPIVQGPMAGADTPALAAAVSAAGGLGMLGCGMRSPDAMAEAVAQVRQRTDRPFGINLFVQDTPAPSADGVARAQALLAPLYAELDVAQSAPVRWCEDFAAQFDALLALRPVVASFTFGILNTQQVAQLHAAGCCVVGTATTVAEALAWVHVGADAVCASGLEAGGHRGTFLGDWKDALVGTMALLPACADALAPHGVALVAAGGIMDGRGIRAAQALGAQAVQMGTAFLACEESGISPVWRAALARSGATDTRLTRAISGRPARGIVNRLIQDLEALGVDWPAYPVQNALTAPLRRAAAAKDQGDYLSLWAGQGVGAVRPMPAADLLHCLEAEMGWVIKGAGHTDRLRASGGFLAK